MDFFGAQNTIFYTNMLPTVFYDKRVFVKFKISNNFEQNIDETNLKQPKIHRKINTSPWILKSSRKKSSNQKFRDFCQISVISTQKSIPYTVKKGLPFSRPHAGMTLTKLSLVGNNLIIPV